MGRAARERSCPALGRTISSAECAVGRAGTVRCPEDCRYHVFAAARYDDFLGLEAKITQALTERMILEPGGRRRVLGDLPFSHRYPDASGEDEVLARTLWLLFGEPSDAGSTRAQRYAPALQAVLDGEGRRLLAGMAQMRMALLEVRAILDAQTCEAIDLLEAEPAPIRIRDRGLAATATRFFPLACWIYPTPFFWRTQGIAAVVPIMSPHEPLEIIQEIARHLGSPTESEALRVWLGANLVRVVASIDHVGQARRRSSLRQTDTRFCRVTYRLLRPLEECLAVLDRAADVSAEPPTQKDRSERVLAVRTFLDIRGDARDPAASALGEAVLGRVRFRARFCRAEIMGGGRTARLRERLETLLGSRVELVRERSRDLAPRILGSRAEPDPRLVPPRLLEGAEAMELSATRVSPLPFGDPGRSIEELTERIEVEQDRLWLDLPVPALDGKTPREAGRNPELRPRLIHLLKCRVRRFDEDNLRKRRPVPDLDWMLRELGAPELLFPQPPVRP